jgi:hypothetical protein
LAILVDMGKKNGLGPFLVGDFVFDYSVGAVFKSLVVDIFAFNAAVAIKNSLFVVAGLGF